MESQEQGNEELKVMRITLYTADMGHVADFAIPSFEPAPEVVVWGSRTFVRDRAKGVRECFAYGLTITEVIA